MGKKRRQPLRLEVPFSADHPQLTSEAVGLDRILRRPSTSYGMDVTILDVNDARLLRAGVVVAHRVFDGYGEWYLAAKGWEPHLPTERVEPLQSGDLPDDFARLLRPLLRHGVLGALAALHVDREEWSLRSADGDLAAEVRDERVTVRRSGMITARYREITITPAKQLTAQQREFLLSAAQAVNATVLDEFPTVQQRLGAPATGLTSFPAPAEIVPGATLEEFVTSVFARHLDRIVRAALARRAAGSDDVGDLNAKLWAFARDLRGLSWVLEPGWREATERALTGLPFASPAEAEPPMLDVVEALVGAARAPRLGDLAHRPAAELMFQRAQQGTLILADRCDALTLASPDEQWQGALRAAELLEVVAGVAAPLFDKGVSRMLKRLGEVTDDLRACAVDKLPGEPELDGLSAAQAFQLGRDLERKRASMTAVREEFIARWPDRVTEARAMLAKARKKRKK